MQPVQTMINQYFFDSIMYHVYIYALILSTTILLLILHQDKKKNEVFQNLIVSQ